MHVGRQLHAQLAQTGKGDIVDIDIGTQAGSQTGGRLSDGAAPEDEHLGRLDAGHAADELALAALGLLEIIGAAHRRHASGHLAHRDEERQTAVGSLHGLIGQADGTALDHGLGQLTVGGEMEIGEEKLAGPHECIFGFDGLLHLDDHLRGSVHVSDRRQDLGTYLPIVSIGETAAFTGCGLNIDGVAVLDEFVNSRRGHAHAVLIVFNFFWNTNFHRIYSLWL